MVDFLLDQQMDGQKDKGDTWMHALVFIYSFFKSFFCPISYNSE